jgi:hypothetical protein
VAKAGCEHVRKNFSYEAMFTSLLAWKTTPEEKLKGGVIEIARTASD